MSVGDKSNSDNCSKVIIFVGISYSSVSFWPQTTIPIISRKNVMDDFLSPIVIIKFETAKVVKKILVHDKNLKHLAIYL